MALLDLSAEQRRELTDAKELLITQQTLLVEGAKVGLGDEDLLKIVERELNKATFLLEKSDG